MATSPKLPDFPDIPPRKTGGDHDDHAKVQRLKQGKFPWWILAVIVAAAMVITVFVVLWRTPNATKSAAGQPQIPKQPTTDQIELTNLRLVHAPAGGSIYVDALLHNAGTTAVTGVQVQAEFLNRTGESLATATAPVESLAGGTNMQPLNQLPIQPHETRPIRIYFAHTPKGWNRDVPEMTVTMVTGTTQ